MANLLSISFSGIDYKQIRTLYEPDYGTFHIQLNPPTRPCFNIDLLLELNELLEHLSYSGGNVRYEARFHPVRFMVVSSLTEGVFSLGGDLARIRMAIKRQDRAWLQRYAELCIANLWLLYQPNFPVTTISLVEGTALGGGFETALATDLLVASSKSRFGFPESIFNLFPGMGAISFLSRRIGLAEAKNRVSSGQIYTPDDLHAVGVIDVLAEPGNGREAVDLWISKHYRTLNSIQSINRAKKIVSKLDKKELMDVADVWVDAALNMNEKNMRAMQTLIRAQINRPRLKAVS